MELPSLQLLGLKSLGSLTPPFISVPYNIPKSVCLFLKKRSQNQALLSVPRLPLWSDIHLDSSSSLLLDSQPVPSPPQSILCSVAKRSLLVPGQDLLPPLIQTSHYLNNTCPAPQTAITVLTLALFSVERKETCAFLSTPCSAFI